MKKGAPKETDRLLAMIRSHEKLRLSQRLRLTMLLSVPAVLAQVSAIVMQYIDAAMVGRLGAGPAASIGLVSTTTWLFWGLCGAMSMGFSVQVAHRIGAADFDGARSVLRQSLTASTAFGVLLALIGAVISGPLPRWLGGDPTICHGSTVYFAIFALFLPAFQLSSLSGAMLRCSGNMRVPSILSVAMCVLDVVFNFFLIFSTRTVSLGPLTITVPGAGLGVAGAALGTAAAEAVTALVMLWYLWRRSPQLRLSGTKGSFGLTRPTLRRALRIGLPMGLEHAVICGAQIATTVIVAPLGIMAIAANSFAITAESLCYMPGYGISEAATTLVGQSLGAGRRRLTRSFATICVSSGMAVMSLMGVLLYLFAPAIIGLMTSVPEIVSLGVMALRIEAFAEPMFAASIVAYGVFVGAADTLVPSLMNVGSIWGVRLTLAAWLAPTMGLRGVWMAMAVELCFRGSIFLLRLIWGGWMKTGPVPKTTTS